MKPRQTETITLTNEAQECEILAAGTPDPLFGEFVPDKFTAFTTLHFGKTLPHVVGPEMISGRVFGIHPAVVARSFSTIQFKQMNLGHQLKSLGGKRDRICGCVLQCAFPEEPEGGWEVPATVEEAPMITAFAALFKQAEGVSDMLGKHFGGKIKMAVSMEFTFFHDQVGVYDPATNTTYDREDIPQALKGFLNEDEQGRLSIRKAARRQPLVLALGGLSHNVTFSGVGYTDRPADKLAGIDSIAAARHEEGMIVCGGTIADLPAPGMEVRWTGGKFNRGVVAAVYLDGRHALNFQQFEATPDDPLLCIRLPDNQRILRPVSSLLKKF